MKKNIIKTITFLGFIIAVLGAIIDPMIANVELRAYTYLFNGVSIYIAVAAMLGAVFVFSKNTTVENVGYALCAFVGALGVTMIMNDKAFPLMLIPVGFIVMLVGAILQFLLIAIKFFGFVKSNDCKAVGDVSDILTKYKELEKDKVISEEEFNDLKTKTIAASANDKISLEDLKKWKKLLDQGIITETEFSDMKAKLFTK